MFQFDRADLQCTGFHYDTGHQLMSPFLYLTFSLECSGSGGCLERVDMLEMKQQIGSQTI